MRKHAVSHSAGCATEVDGNIDLQLAKNGCYVQITAFAQRHEVLGGTAYAGLNVVLLVRAQGYREDLELGAVMTLQQLHHLPAYRMIVKIF